MFSCKLEIADGAMEKHSEAMKSALFPLEIEIVSNLFSIALVGYGTSGKDEWHGSKPWTKAVLGSLNDLGTHMGYLVYPQRTSSGKLSGEWMFDFVWLDARSDKSGVGFDWRFLRNLKLACECEWSTAEENILEDFHKLTFIDAEIRLFIYTNVMVQSDSEKVSIPDLCKAVCLLSKGNRYLLVGFPNQSPVGIQVDAWTA